MLTGMIWSSYGVKLCQTHLFMMCISLVSYDHPPSHGEINYLNTSKLVLKARHLSGSAFCVVH